MSVAGALSIAAPFTGQLEGFRANPYWDVNGYAIGYGNHYYEDGSPVELGDDPITPAQGLHLLNFTLSQVAAGVSNLLYIPVSDSMLAALTDLAYNWGIGNLGRSILLTLINSEASQDEIISQWQVTATTSGGQTNSDLISRRALEARLAYSNIGSQEAGIPLLIIIILLFYFVFRKK